MEKAINKDDIFSIGAGNKMKYFPHFARPFFKIRKSGIFDIKGIEGNNSIRVHLKNPEQFSIQKLIHFLENIENL